MVAIRIDNEYLDLQDPDFSIVKAANDIAKLESRQGSISVDFDIPNTGRNARLLQYSNNPNIVYGSKSPYTKIVSKLYQNNIEISSGYIRINYDESTQRQINITFFGNNIDVFDQLKNVDLSDLDLSRFNHVYRGSVVAGSGAINGRTEGYVYAPINYGSKDTTVQFSFGMSSSLLNSKFSNTNDGREILPSTFIHTVLDQMAYHIGYTIAGNFKTNPLYRKLLLLFSKKYFVNSTGDGGFDIKATLTSDQVYTFPTSPVKLFYDQLDSGLLYNPITGRYTATKPVRVALEFYTIAQGSSIIRYYIYKNGSHYTGIISNPTTTIYTTTYNAETAYIPLAAGDYLEIYVDNFGPSSITLKAGTYMRIFSDGVVVEGGPVELSKTLPDITCADLLKDLCMRFGLIVNTDYNSKTISLDFFNKVKDNIESAKDWTNKIDFVEEKVTDYTSVVDGYAKVNYLYNAEDSSDDLLVNYQNTNAVGYCDGSINVNNEFLDGENDLYESCFAATINANCFVSADDKYAYLPRIQRFTDGVLQNECTPRIGIYLGDFSVSEFSSETSISINSADGNYAYSEMPFVYFYKKSIGGVIDTFIENLAFGDPIESAPNGVNLLDRYYPDYIKILNYPNMYKPLVRLTEVDISTLDFSIPIWLEQTKRYYYLNKIDGYEANGTSTPVELIAL
jgi:hypothetical protein